MTNVPGPVPAPSCEHGRVDFENCSECRKRRAAKLPQPETAAEWIGRHEAEYQWDEAHAQDSCYLKFNHAHKFAVIENATGGKVCINLETAADCIKLCEILRVTPVEREVDNG